MEKKELSDHIKNRPEQLMREREQGRKVIAFFPGNYVPEEIIYASGAIPICLIHGGNTKTVDASLDQMPDIMCPFSRAQVGELVLGTNPFYTMIDMLVAPITCQHLKKAAEIWEYRTDINLFKLGVPPQSDMEFGLEYYSERLKILIERVENLTGNRVTDNKLHEAIELYNNVRSLFRKISLLRRNHPLPLSSSDFLNLNHVSFYADPHFTIDILEKICSELENTPGQQDTDRPRLLLLGPNIAYGDDKIFKLIESSGADIVVEELCEGTRFYWNNISSSGDPVRSLAEGYLRDRLPCAFMRRSSRKRLNFALDLINDFNISGVIWYELLGCETYDAESYFFAQKMGEHGIPILIIESDYSTSDLSQLRTRTEAFVEQIEGVY